MPIWQQTYLVSEFAESEVSVILAQEQAMFGTRGEHAIRLARAFGDEIINKDADVGLVSTEHDGFHLTQPECGVDTGHQTLGSGFLIA